jgi:DNA-binding XRE family transcriptional regulator
LHEGIEIFIKIGIILVELAWRRKFKTEGSGRKFMVQTDKLKGIMIEKKATYEDGAKAIGVSVTTFSKKMNGKCKFYVEEAEKLSNFLDLSNEERCFIFLS